jgi:hypothetical protein
MANADLDRLFDYLVKFAQKMLAEHGEFHPFGAVIGANGKLAAAGSHGPESATSLSLIETLAGGFRTMATRGALIACGICYDVRVALPGETAKVDAIQCRLEHSGGDAADVFLAYSKASSGHIEYGRIWGFGRERDVFPENSTQQ